MIDDVTLNRWFCREILPLERSLTHFIRRNCATVAEVTDLRQEIYERALTGARGGLPNCARAYLYTVARNHLINRARRARIVSFELVADLEQLDMPPDYFDADRHLDARDGLRRTQAGLDQLPPRCREVVWLRKIEGLSTKEAAARMGVGIDAIERQLTQGMRALANYMLGGSGKIERPRRKRASHRRAGLE